MPDHVHLLINLGAETALATAVGAVKQATSIWLKKDLRSPHFVKWSREYYGVSLSPSHKDQAKQYILNQETHHKAETFDEELDRLITKALMVRYRDSFYE